MPRSYAHDRAGLERALRDEARRDRPGFDPDLHRRVMAALHADHTAAESFVGGSRGWRATRYALAACAVGAAGLLAVWGSGWLQQQLRDRQARREALAWVASLPQATSRVSPPQVLGDADRLLARSWQEMQGSLRGRGEGIEGIWGWWVRSGLSGLQPHESENKPGPDAGEGL